MQKGLSIYPVRPRFLPYDAYPT